MCKFLQEEESLASTFNTSGLKTKKETVNLALEEFIQKRKRKETMELFGKTDFNKDWSPKKAWGKIDTTIWSKA